MQPGARTRIGGVIAVAALATTGIVLFGGGSAPAPPLPSVAAAASVPVPAATEVVTVYVSGEVADPGLVAVVGGARIADAIAAAGGATARAYLGALNLAAPVRDGDRIVVPGVGDSDVGSGVESIDDGRIRLNMATVSELEEIPGVGPVLAQRIADHREAHGPFATVEDLLDVSGIGEAKLATMRDSVVVP